jgi:predicted transcriptional regulator
LSLLGDIVKDGHVYVQSTDSVRKAVELLAKQTAEVLPVIAPDSGKVIGVLSYRDILSTYKDEIEENEHPQVQISLKRQRLKMLIRGRKLINLDEQREES